MHQKSILCYGDSNTWGYVPMTPYLNCISQRYSYTQRWTGILQQLLGDYYYLIEEGLNSRTTNLNYQVPPDRNGKTYLAPCLYSHAPIDLIVLALGSNDFKVYFNRSPQDISIGLSDLIDTIQTSNYGPNFKTPPKILVITPPIPLPIAETIVDENSVRIYEGSIKKANLLIDLYKNLAKEKNCYFLDITQEIIPSAIDGCHLDSKAHKKLANILFTIIKNIL